MSKLIGLEKNTTETLENRLNYVKDLYMETGKKEYKIDIVMINQILKNRK